MENFNIKEDVFSSSSQKIDPKSEIIFVSDLFAEDYEGGAELTTEALISSSPLKISKIRSKDVTIDLLKEGSSKFWIFGNFAALNLQLIPSIIGNIRYSILEYDYKYCQFRSPEKHLSATGSPCDCHNKMYGKIISAFMYGAECLWWMSEDQKRKYQTIFPFLSEKSNIVLSSVFSKNTLGTIKWLRNHISSTQVERKNWIVLGSNSWIKGADEAVKWCKENNKDYEIVWGLKYEDLLNRLAQAEGFVYLPKGCDTCPRMVIEAKLLGCKLHLNDNVQHAKEEWFDTENLEEIEEYLFGADKIFWNGIIGSINYKPKISGYTMVYNADSQGYPFVQCIKSMLNFCDEVCVLDGGSTDKTFDILQEMSKEYPKLKIGVHKVDFNKSNFAYESDGLQKARARDMCTGDFCWQMDCDEVVHEEDYQKIIDLCRRCPPNVNLISLPVVEYWGGPNKVRADVMPWKWRLSRNIPSITHGIPKEFRRIDEQGNVFAAASDGCDMIDRESGERIPDLNFYNLNIEKIRRLAVQGDKSALEQYQNWFNQAVDQLPGVFHYSWYDIERKIKLYKSYWTKFWVSLSGKKYEDTAESNMMFDVPWSDVTDEMITTRAKELAEIGGWIWHQKWNGKVKTHHVTISKKEPKIMRDEK